jgi:P27 family predicted phage terminase small subunit
MPDGLSEAAQRMWERTAPILLKLGTLTIADGAEFAGFCQSYADWLDAQALIAEYGQLVKEPIVNRAGDVVGNRLKKNPACTIASDMKKAMRAFASDFGLSPAARTRVHASPTDDNSPEDEVDALLNQ